MSAHRTVDHGLVIAATGGLSVLVVAVLAHAFYAGSSPAAWVGSAFSLGALALGLGGVWHHVRERELALEALARQARQLDGQGRDLAHHVVELERANEALARSNRELDQFAYVASHDLKAPLRGIASLAGWIEEDLGDDAPPQTREHLRLLRGRVERMHSLIEGILAYSRAGRFRGDLGTVDVDALVDEVCDLLPPPRGVRIERVGRLPVMRTYRVALQQIWLNLVGNAITHGARPGGRIEIGGAPEGDHWRFWVSDDGPGIAPAYHDRIFEMFQTLLPRDTVEGAGIGLAVVRKLVEAHGGRVWVTSSPGAGSTFTFTWSQCR